MNYMSESDMRNYISELKQLSITEEMVNETNNKSLKKMYSDLKMKSKPNLGKTFISVVNTFKYMREGKLECKKCNFKATNMRSMESHKKSKIHIARENGDEIIKCGGCGKEFGRQDINDHYLNSHKCASKSSKVKKQQTILLEERRVKQELITWNLLTKKIKEEGAKKLSPNEKCWYNNNFYKFMGKGNKIATIIKDGIRVKTKITVRFD